MLVINNDNGNKSKNIIEIVACSSGIGSLKQSNFKNNLIVYLPLELSFGDLKSLDNYNRECLKELYNYDDYFPFEEGYVFQKEIGKLKEYVAKADKIRIWSSHKSTNEFLLFLYICYLFPNNNISVVFADEYNSDCWSIGCTNFKEVNKLAEKEHILLQRDKELYISEWKKIVSVNSELRCIKNGKIESVTIDYFNKTILSYLENKEIEFMELVGRLMADSVIDNDSVFVYIYLINRLIKQEQIQVIRIDESNRRILKENQNIKIGGDI